MINKEYNVRVKFDIPELKDHDGRWQLNDIEEIIEKLFKNLLDNSSFQLAGLRLREVKVGVNERSSFVISRDHDEIPFLLFDLKVYAEIENNENAIRGYEIQGEVSDLKKSIQNRTELNGNLISNLVWSIKPPSLPQIHTFKLPEVVIDFKKVEQGNEF